MRRPAEVTVPFSGPVTLSPCHWVAHLLLAVAALATPARGAAPREELLRFVPEDVGFCLLLQDLRGHAAAFLASPFVEQFRRSPLGLAMRASPESDKLAAVEQRLLQHLELTWARLRDDLVGDAVVLAYRPGPPRQPNREQGLLLVRAREARLLADVCDRLNRVQKEAGDLELLEARVYQGVTYYRRVERRGKVQYYCLRGPVLLFTPQEDMLLQALDLERTAPAAGEPPLARQLSRLGADKGLAALWINPRAFEPELRRELAEAEGAKAAVLNTFLVYWEALEGIALSVALGKDLEAAVAVRAKVDGFPPAAGRLFAAAARPCELWDRLPENALLAVAGRVDVPALAELLSQFVSAEVRQAVRAEVDRTIGAALGKDVFREVLPYLGPDWGLWVTAPSAPDKEWFPQVTLALRVRPGGNGVPVDRALVNALSSFALLAVLGYNRHHPDQLSLKALMQGQVEVKYLVNDKRFPPGCRPAIALKDGYLVLASSPEAIGRFGGASPDRDTGSGARDVPLLRLSLHGVRTFLSERREPLTGYSAGVNRLAKEVVARAIDALLMGLEPLDRLELSQRGTTGQVTLTLRVRTAWPLRR